MCDKQDSVLQCSQNLDTEMCVTYPRNVRYIEKVIFKVKRVLKRNVYPVLCTKFECFFYYLQCTEH